MSSRSFGNPANARTPYLPRLLGTRGAVACEHYLAAQAARDLLLAGGNAVDAAVGATLVEGTANPHMHTLGGECPMLIHMAGNADVVAVNGNTAAPAAATVAAYRERNLECVPDEGVLAAGVPAAVHALLTALERFGRLSFRDVSAAALALARHGFPVHAGLQRQLNYGIAHLADKFRDRWPASARLYLPHDRVPAEGQLLHNPALADLLEDLGHVEARARGGRERGLAAVRDRFYGGDVAAEIASFVAERDGLLARADLAAFETRIERPVSVDFRGTQIFKCGPWNQGPVLLQALRILDCFELAAMGHNSAEYLHTLIEAMNLAFADREQYYGDPQQVDVPMDALLCPRYGRLRAALIDPGRANAELRPGDPRGGGALLAADERLGGAAWGAGTVHVDVVDREGNFASFTPSGGWLKSCEVVPALGFPLGNRLMTFYLAPERHPNLLAPGKRPRTTISPSLAFRAGAPWMTFGSMGGDQQDQWQLQFLLNRTVFGMGLQESIEAPKLSSEHFPGFFAPHDRFPRHVCVEPRLGDSALAGLRARGHDLEIYGDWTEGYLLAVARDGDTGVLEAGCDPRGAKGDVFPAFALAW